MSSRNKRKLDFDPNASDPDDSDYDATERRNTPQKRRRPPPGSAKKQKSKRPRRAYAGSDIEDDDQIESDDSFTGRSEESAVEINPTTGRSVRRAGKQISRYTWQDSRHCRYPSQQSYLSRPRTAHCCPL